MHFEDQLINAVEEVRVFEWLRALPDEIIRVKVLLKLKSDRQSRFLYERVSGEVSPAPIPVREIARVPCSGIFIGPTLDPDEILHFTLIMEVITCCMVIE